MKLTHLTIWDIAQHLKMPLPDLTNGPWMFLHFEAEIRARGLYSNQRLGQVGAQVFDILDTH
jgi:hypothetical protein